MATLTNLVEKIAVSGFLTRQGCQVFLVDVVLLDGSCQQLLRRYADFVALQTALEQLDPAETNDVPLAALPSYKQLLPRVYRKDSSVLVPKLTILTEYCKALLEISGNLADESCLVNFFTTNEFDTQLKRGHLVNSQTQASFDVPQGKFFKTCMVLGDFYHTSEFGPFESQAGEMVAFIGSDSEKWSLVGRSIKGKMQLGWLPENYLIELPEDESDPMMDDVHHFLLCVQMSQTAETEDTFLSPKYSVIGRLPEETAYDTLPPRLLDLEPGSLVTVVDKDEDGWWFVSSPEVGEGWFPSTLLKLQSTLVPLDEGELDEMYSKLRPGHKHHLGIFYTLRKYTAGKDDELSFDKGMPLEVLHRSTSGWWTVRCGGKVGLYPAVYLTRHPPIMKHSASTPHRRPLNRSASICAGSPQAPFRPPLLQRSLTIYKPQSTPPAYSIGFNASKMTEPPPRKSLISAAVLKESMASRNSEDLRLKTTPRNELLQVVRRRLQEAFYLRRQSPQSTSEDESSPRAGVHGGSKNIRRVSTHVSIQQMHPFSLPGSPELGRWSWLDEDNTEGDLGLGVPGRFAGKKSPTTISRGHRQSSKGEPKLTGSLPGSPASKASRSSHRLHSKGTIPDRFLQSPHQAPMSHPSSTHAKQPMKSPIPTRFLRLKESIN